MPSIEFIYILLTSLIISLLVLPRVYSLAQRIGGFDQPDNRRKLHSCAVPRLGGIAILAGLLISMFIYCPPSPLITGMLAGGGIIFLLGLIDDLQNLTSLQKLSGQLVGVATGVLLGDNHLASLGNLLGLGEISFPPAVGIPLTIICIVGVVNAINMIDGLDGLAGGVTAIACMAFALIAFSCGNQQVLLVSLALFGATLGFLTHNAFPARIFMGDAGSNLLGFVLGMMAVALMESPGRVSPVAPLLILSVPILDTLIVMGSRLYRGKSIMSADRGHLHHRLLDLGLGHKATVIVVYGCSYFMAAVAVMAYEAPDTHLMAFLAVAALLFYYGMQAVSRWLVPRFGLLTSDQPLVSTRVYRSVAGLANQALLGSSYLLVLILALMATIDLPTNPRLAATATAVLVLLCVASFTRLPCNNQLLQICICGATGLLVFQTEMHALKPASGLSSYTAWNALFLILLPIISFKLLIRNRLNIVMHYPFDYLLFLVAIFVPLLPNLFPNLYYLPAAVAKSIILFVTCKLILNRQDARAHRLLIIFALILALVAFVINKLV